MADERSAAFERFFLEEYGRVVGIARRIVGDAATAEDVAQDVFATWARMRHDVDGGRAALYVASARVALNALRGRRRRDRRERRFEQMEAPVRSADAGDPQQIFDRREQRALVRRAMRRIPERSATLLALRYGGLSYREIAQSLALDEAQIGTLLARAQRAFRKEIEDVTQR